jgi:hypothetical protein
MIVWGSVSRINRRVLLAAIGLLLPILLMGAMCSLAFAQHDSLWVRTMYGTGSGIDEVQALAAAGRCDEGLPEECGARVAEQRGSQDRGCATGRS